MEKPNDVPVWLAVWIRGMGWGAGCGAVLGVLSNLGYAADGNVGYAGIAFGYGATLGFIVGAAVGLASGVVLGVLLRVCGSATLAAIVTVVVVMTPFGAAAYGFWSGLPDDEAWPFLLGGPALAVFPMTYTVVRQARRSRSVTV